MTIQLEEIGYNLLGYDGEVYLEDDRLIAEVSIRQEYIVDRGDYFYPETISHKDIDVYVNSIYFITNEGKGINVFSREIENFVKESIEIEY